MNLLYMALQAGNRSGTGRYTEALLDALIERRDQADVTGLTADALTVLWPRDFSRPRQVPGLQVLPRNPRGLARIFAEHWEVRRFRDHHDIVHYPASIGPIFHPGLPTVVTVHDLSFLRHPEWFRKNRAWYYHYWVARSVQVADHLIADSQATADDLMNLLEVPANRISVAHLGVTPHFRPATGDHIAVVRETYNLPEHFFLYVGTLEPRKNIASLIRAWSQIAGEIPQDLVIAGRRGWKLHSVHRAWSKSSYRDRIHFPGYIPQEHLPALLCAADAFTWPSLFEGFGLPPLEAMACGTPVLTANTSSLPEVVGDAALTVSPHDLHAMAQALRRLSRDAGLREALRFAGHARAAQFTWRNTAKTICEAYQYTMDNYGR